MQNDNPIVLKTKALNLVRTVSRNNVERLSIADQKASVLLSINAIMITILLPMVFTHTELLTQRTLYIPLIMISLTCLATLFFTGFALMPIKMSFSKSIYEKNYSASPFFFGNFFKMSPKEYSAYFHEALANEDQIGDFILQDLFHIGKVVAHKYVIIRNAYFAFILGLLLSIISALTLLLF